MAKHLTMKTFVARKVRIVYGKVFCNKAASSNNESQWLVNYLVKYSECI